MGTKKSHGGRQHKKSLSDKGKKEKKNQENKSVTGRKRKAPKEPRKGTNEASLEGGRLTRDTISQDKRQRRERGKNHTGGKTQTYRQVNTNDPESRIQNGQGKGSQKEHITRPRRNRPGLRKRSDGALVPINKRKETRPLDGISGKRGPLFKWKNREVEIETPDQKKVPG